MRRNARFATPAEVTATYPQPIYWELVFPALLLLFAPAAAEPIDDALRQFTEVFSAVEQNAADPIDPPKAMFEGAIPGMLRRLDPHSIFFDPVQFNQLRELEKSTRKGFGSVVSLLPGRVIVLQTLPGTPSSKSGLNPGDEMLAINGIDLSRLTIDQLIQLLTASRQQQVRLDVRRPCNARLITLFLTPEDVDAPSVERVFHLRPGIGYVRVASFDAPTGKQIREAIEKLGGASLAGLVLDLRNNPGGLMPSALETASLFLKAGQKIVSVKGRSVKGEEITVPEKATPYAFPVAVLMNAKSASGSEIVAGAIQDHKRGAVVGEPSFGKGLVQSVFPLSQGTGMALTTAFYYTPAGRSIQRHLTGELDRATADQKSGGIQPDRVVYPPQVTRLQAVLEASGSFPSFATDYIRRNTGITRDFEVSDSLLDEFQVAMSSRNIRPSVGEWSTDSDWIRSRLKQEILNQAVGVAVGDEVEAAMDPVVLAALDAIGAK